MTNCRNKLIPLSYLGPVQLFAHLKDGDHVIVEQHCNYERKSYRNRCNIVGANGPMALSVPVLNQKNVKIKTRDTLISFETDWQNQHWRSITSAYNSSPFFEYYADAFEPFYKQEFSSLVEFDMALFKTVLNELELNLTVSLSQCYTPVAGAGTQDLRAIIHPKRSREEDPHFVNTRYWQVFGQKFGFSPNMSILDLIFNMGPEAPLILERSLKLQ